MSKKIKTLIAILVVIISGTLLPTSIEYFVNNLEKSESYVEDNVSQDTAHIVDKYSKVQKVYKNKRRKRNRSKSTEELNYYVTIKYYNNSKTFNVTPESYSSFTIGNEIPIYTLDGDFSIAKSDLAYDRLPKWYMGIILLLLFTLCLSARHLINVVFEWFKNN